MMVEIEHLTGDGWLHFGTVRVAQVSYAIETVLVSEPIDGTDVRVKLSRHAINPDHWQNRVLTLQLLDGRSVRGFLSSDGSRLVRTGPIAA